MGIEFIVSTEAIPTNKSSKYDEIITAIKGLENGQHLQIGNTSPEIAGDVSNAIRSAAKSRGMKLNVTRRGTFLYIKEKKS